MGSTGVDISAWLRNLGLERYEPTFRDNEITAEVLPELTDADLRELGLPLGPRKTLLKAIASLRTPADVAGHVLTHAASELSSRSHDMRPAAEPQAERRRLTVMFCDLVGSTALAARLDPEDLREVIGTYHGCVAQTVARFDGFVAKYMGDGVLAYFGYPQAHEDDAERAVRTGLALIEAVGRLQALDQLHVRIGIETGLVVVGDLVGAGEAQERGIVGETPNLAARLQAIAEPDTVVIGPRTRRLLGNLFECRDLGPVAIKGFPAAVHAHRVLRSSVVESRFEALHGAALTPLVGRDEEVELLLRRWQRARSGSGQIVLLSGEPGIGKSRLTATLLDEIAGEPHTRLRYFCSPYHTDSALFPLIAQLERAAGFERDDDPPAKLIKLDALLARTSTAAEDRRRIADLLSLPAVGPDLTTDLSPQQRKQKTLEALVRQLESLARQRPALMIFEDVHWIDPTSLEVMDRIVERIRRLPVLLVMTFRPEFHPPWVGQSHVAMLMLSRLDQHDGAALVERIVGNRALPLEVAREIVERTDGVPLFVEELTKAVLEAYEEGGAAAWAPSTAASAAHAIPATLHASLMARLDRLGSAAKEVAQIGAVIGREFSYEHLSVVGEHPEADLQAALGQLVEAGLALCRGVPPQATYLFKHALVQDAAYSSLLRSHRQRLHARLAELLEAEGALPELLAHHCQEAGLMARAVHSWSEAGLHAVERSANTEAERHLSRARSLLQTFPPGPQRDRQELAILSPLGAALQATRAFSSAEAHAVFERLRELASQHGDNERLFQALYALRIFHLMRGNLQEASAVVHECLRAAERMHSGESLQTAQLGMGIVCHYAGDFPQAAEWLERSLETGKHTQRALPFLRVVDVRTNGLAYLGWNLCLLGHLDRGGAALDAAVDSARRLDHPMTLASALMFRGLAFREVGEYEEAIRTFEQLLEIARLQRLSWWEHNARSALASVNRDPVHAPAAIEEVNVCLDYFSSIGSIRSWILSSLAWQHVLSGDGVQALAAVDEAQAEERETGHSNWSVELNRLRSHALLACKPSRDAEAEAALREGIAGARRHQARLLELLSATDLVRLLTDRDRGREAREILAPVYSWFTEGLDTPVLRTAKGLLDTLG
jgi:class 3 adenylate cyclase/tetratricopeptide (TPR) repeat protein